MKNFSIAFDLHTTIRSIFTVTVVDISLVNLLFSRCVDLLLAKSYIGASSKCKPLYWWFRKVDSFWSSLLTQSCSRTPGYALDAPPFLDCFGVFAVSLRNTRFLNLLFYMLRSAFLLPAYKPLESLSVASFSYPVADHYRIHFDSKIIAFNGSWCFWNVPCNFSELQLSDLLGIRLSFGRLLRVSNEMTSKYFHSIRALVYHG